MFKLSLFIISLALIALSFHVRTLDLVIRNFAHVKFDILGFHKMSWFQAIFAWSRVRLAVIIRVLVARSAHVLNVVRVKAYVFYNREPSTIMEIDPVPKRALIFRIAVHRVIHALTLTTRLHTGVQKVSCILPFLPTCANTGELTECALMVVVM